MLGDDRLGRALEAFAPVAETVRGAIVLAAIDTYGADAARLHLDLTTLTVSGHYPGSHPQRTILTHLYIDLPWPEQDQK